MLPLTSHPLVGKAGVEPAPPTYKDGAQTATLHALVGYGGVEPPLAILEIARLSLA